MTKPSVTRAVFPVAGLGTRFLPATKAVPKEIMTLIDRPLVQYAIDEARAAGIEEFIFVTARGKGALEDYFDEAPALAAALRRQSKHELLAGLKRTEMASGAIAYVRQREPLGLGHAVWCARHLIGDEPFAVILPDDVIAAETPCLKQMVKAHAEIGGNLVAAMEVPRAQVSSHGILDAGGVRGDVIRVRGMVEKPLPDAAPSTLAVIGRYILTPEVLGRLGGQAAGAGDEIQLTDAIAAEIGGTGVHGFRFEGRRYDCGSKAGYLQATVAFALARDDMKDEFADFLNSIMEFRVAAE
ncbi:UTP--glucose-1-phosphate uridylyltransferase [Ovoidimarina sediminis]|uniref:UTP--glucose-1-phosphate uridylyltransferase n=1 Tax=Ovoidimarina sediminis TaxID=3079856 RepID=UPI00291178B7|nr:UTP--glucose-1-phosphate uridylyltransferase [Rhodophyticola sp. MJ-SS7]MDU8943177.1 UTP--glucose-1-phosphate uridylyltransferase [Rhodophyticola sp. MJ-SS7]